MYVHMLCLIFNVISPLKFVQFNLGRLLVFSLAGFAIESGIWLEVVATRRQIPHIGLFGGAHALY